MEKGLTKGIEIIVKRCKELPQAPGIYKMISINNELLYVGKAKNLPKRVISYSKLKNLPNRLCRMVSLLERIEYSVTKTEAEALLLEASLIKTLKPRFNIALKDDKSFPYICIEEDHPFPRITKYRGKKRKEHNYFGPFASARNVTQTITELQKLFLIRPCSNSFFANRTLPCLQYQIKRCSAPCVNKISVEDYAAQIKQTKAFLLGKNSEVQDNLIKQMQQMSDNTEYEKAASIRDRIKILSSIQAKNILKTDDLIDADIVALHRHNHKTIIHVIFIRNGNNYGGSSYFPENVEEDPPPQVMENFLAQLYQSAPPPPLIITTTGLIDKNLLETALSQLAGGQVKIKVADQRYRHILEFATNNAVQELAIAEAAAHKIGILFQEIAIIFNLPSLPERIEVYDNSHIQGAHPVGCRIVAGRGGFIKSQYRKFNFQDIKVGDDYAMMKEMLTRRLKRTENLPDLLLIDGGAGHLTTVTEVMKELNMQIPYACIAKGINRNAGREIFHMPNRPPFQLPFKSPVLHYLQYIRDEVHRFAITTHRNKRSKEMRKSSLDDIPQIGKHRKKLLLAHFGSVEAIANTSAEDLMRLPGINNKIARLILDTLNSTD